MGLSRTVSEIDGNIGRKSQNFPTPLYFAPPLKEFSLELCTGTGGQKTRMMGLPGGLDTMYQRDGRTNRWTDTGRQQKAALKHSVAR